MFEFKDVDYLTDGEIDLIIFKKIPEDSELEYVPAYLYQITLHQSDEVIGFIDIRIGYNENIHYGGNIGYAIKEDYRGNHYASKACKIIKQVALAHDMNRLLITCNIDNIASRKTCENIGLKLIEIVELPKNNVMYLEDSENHKCVYVWNL